MPNCTGYYDTPSEKKWQCIQMCIASSIDASDYSIWSFNIMKKSIVQYFPVLSVFQPVMLPQIVKCAMIAFLLVGFRFELKCCTVLVAHSPTVIK